MDRPDTLIAALVEEDRLLRQLMDECPVSLRDVRGPGGTLSLKETLGHLAFWDTFAVGFFLSKLDASSEKPTPPVNFEQRSREELKRMHKLPFGEILDLYGGATQGLVDFLRGHWHELSPKQRGDFSVPLKHRRHHRLLLAKALAALGLERESMERAEEG